MGSRNDHTLHGDDIIRGTLGSDERPGDLFERALYDLRKYAIDRRHEIDQLVENRDAIREHLGGIIVTRMRGAVRTLAALAEERFAAGDWDGAVSVSRNLDMAAHRLHRDEAVYGQTC